MGLKLIPSSWLMLIPGGRFRYQIKTQTQLLISTLVEVVSILRYKYFGALMWTFADVTLEIGHRCCMKLRGTKTLSK